MDKKPFWKDNVIWVWCETYHAYIANHAISKDKLNRLRPEIEVRE